MDKQSTKYMKNILLFLKEQTTCMDTLHSPFKP